MIYTNLSYDIWLKEKLFRRYVSYEIGLYKILTRKYDNCVWRNIIKEQALSPAVIFNDLGLM